MAATGMADTAVAATGMVDTAMVDTAMVDTAMADTAVAMDMQSIYIMLLSHAAQSMFYTTHIMAADMALVIMALTLNPKAMTSKRKVGEPGKSSRGIRDILGTGLRETGWF